MTTFLRNCGFAALLALGVGQSAPAIARDNPFPEYMKWPFPQATIMHRDFGSVSTCKSLQQAYDDNAWPSGVSLDSLRQIDKRLKTSVFLRPDVGPDTWTPLTATVITGGRKPAADCDDVAVTGAQLAVCAGFPADRLGLIVTQLPTRQNELHVVAFYADPQSGVWVFGDTMGLPRSLENLSQRMHFYAFLDNVTEWWALRDPRSGKQLTGSVGTSSIPDAPVPQNLVEGSCKHAHH